MAIRPTISYNNSDSALVYQPQSVWWPGTFNTTNLGTAGTIHGTNDVTANVTFTFPMPAVGFTFYGMKRSHGGLYSICFDCAPAFDAADFTTIDGFDPTDDGKRPPVALYSRSFDTPGVHHVVLRNIADERGTPEGNSQITIASFVLTLAVPTPTSTTVTTSVRQPAVVLSSSTSSSASATRANVSSNASDIPTAPARTTSSAPTDSSITSPAPISPSPFPVTSPSSPRTTLPDDSSHARAGRITVAAAAAGGSAGLVVLFVLLIYVWKRRARTTDDTTPRPYYSRWGTSTASANTGAGAGRSGARKAGVQDGGKAVSGTAMSAGTNVGKSAGGSVRG